MSLLDLPIRNCGIKIVRQLTNNRVLELPGYPPDEITYYLAKLDQYLSETTDDILTKHAIAHCWFVAIHPLSDHNGHYARSHFGCLWNEQLLSIDTNKLNYNNAILRSIWRSWETKTVNPTPLLQFMINNPNLYTIA